MHCMRYFGHTSSLITITHCVNQAKFLGGLHTLLRQCSPAVLKTFYTKPTQIGYRYSSRDTKTLLLLGKCWLPISQSHWSLPLFLISPRNLSSFTRPFLTMRCMWYETNIVVMERYVVPLAASWTHHHSLLSNGSTDICVHTAASLCRLQTLLLPDSTYVMILICIDVVLLWLS